MFAVRNSPLRLTRYYVLTIFNLVTVPTEQLTLINLGPESLFFDAPIFRDIKRLSSRVYMVELKISATITTNAFPT